MDRNLVNHLNSEQRKREEEKNATRSYEMNLRKHQNQLRLMHHQI